MTHAEFNCHGSKPVHSTTSGSGVLGGKCLLWGMLPGKLLQRMPDSTNETSDCLDHSRQTRQSNLNALWLESCMGAHCEKLLEKEFVSQEVDLSKEGWSIFSPDCGAAPLSLGWQEAKGQETWIKSGRLACWHSIGVEFQWCQQE